MSCTNQEKQSHAPTLVKKVCHTEPDLKNVISRICVRLKCHLIIAALWKVHSELQHGKIVCDISNHSVCPVILWLCLWRWFNSQNL